MQHDEIRLECLKLVYRHDRSPEQNIALAKQFESTLIEVSAESLNKVGMKLDASVKRSSGRPQVNAGKLDPLA